MVFPFRFGVEDEDLVHPGGELGEVIELYWSCKRDVRVVEPEVLRFPNRVGEIEMDILKISG